MNKLTLTLLSASLLGAAAVAQGPNFLLTYSQPETTLSGSGGTVLANLLPNELCYLDLATTPCPGGSAEKWMPRTCSHTMAGDEDGDGLFYNPGIFGRIDAVLSNVNFTSPIGIDTQRSVFWSVSAAMGTNVSATPFRPGDVAHIVRSTLGDGQVEYFMRQEMFNMALGLPPANPIDVDAIAFQPNYGVFFSVDLDTPANTACGPMLVRDGDVLCIPPWALTYTSDMRVASVAPNSAVVVYDEATMDAFTLNAQVADRFGACLNTVGDVESLEIDLLGPTTSIVPCAGFTLPVPALIYSSENGSGASLLTTQFGGQIYNTICGPAGTTCGFGPTFGPQMGIQATSTTTGAPSHVNGVAFSRACYNVLEPQQHVMNVFPGGAPAGAMQIDYGSEYALNIALISLPAYPAPISLPAFPWSPFCFPDLYAFPITIHAWPLFGTWGSFPMIAIPPLWSGKILFQNVSFGSSTFELSTPTVIDVQ